MKRSSMLAVLLLLVFSTLLLSALFDNLTGYYESPPPSDKEWFPWKETGEHSDFVFAVSPADPAIFWRVSTADYYDGFGWSSTTTEESIEEFPKIQNNSDVQIFTIEMNTTEEEVSLPVPPSKTSVSNPTLSPYREFELRMDSVAETYGIRISGIDNKTEIIYQATWYHIDYNEINGSLVSLDNVPQDVRNVYLQLPSLPDEVWELARELKHDSYKVLDQIFADVQYLRTHFDYDFNLWEGLKFRVINRDWVLSYMQWGEGVCIDAATALTVILRCQGIPARISYGFKPERTFENKTYYYSKGAHTETEAYLPPYGWVRFDATPPPADSPRLEASPIKAEGYCGEKVFYQLKVINKRNITDNIRLSVYGKEKWEGRVIPKELVVGPFETEDALIEITIPENAGLDETNVFTVRAMSLYDYKTFSIMAVTEVGKEKRVSTTTGISSVDEFIFRGDYFNIGGKIYTDKNESVHDLPVFILLSETEEEKSTVIGGSSSLIGHFWANCQVPLYVEQGIHNLIAISLGDSSYAPSVSDSVVIKVRARTSLKLKVKSPTFVRDQPAVYGYLFLDDGTSVQNACIILEIRLLDNLSINWKWQTFTDANGVFLTVHEKRFMHPGLFELNVTFLGDEYISGFNATETISVKTGAPTVQSFTRSQFIRGEICLVQGMVDMNKMGMWKEPVTIALDGHPLSTVETDFSGFFFYNFQVDLEEELGAHTLSFIIQPRDLNLSQEVNVTAKTDFSITSSKKASGREWLSLSASLLDDHGLPIPEANIFIENYGLAGKTDNEGNVKFLLDTVRLLPENISLTLRFEGSDTYLPAMTSVTITAEPVIPIVFLLPFIISVTIAISFVAKRSLFYTSKTIELIDEQQKELLPVELDQRTFFTISFPDIRSPFPNVWGVGEKLRIECLPNERMRKRAEGRTVEFLVNDKKTAKSILSKRYTTFSHVFKKKGVYQVAARLINKSQHPTATAEATLRIVDYREEIIDLYIGFLQILDQKHLEIEDEMTAREIENLLLNTGKFDEKILQKVTDCFEKTEYSIHSIERKDYETMYQSLKELKFNAEKTK